MKNILRTYSFVLFTLAMTSASAQDIHFSQFYFSPLTLNPAKTGSVDATYRFCGIYRNQWASVTIPYVTYSASFDASLFRGHLNNDAIGTGLIIMNDHSGDGNLSNLTIGGSLAYQKAIDPDGNFHLGIGAQAEYVQKSVDLSKLTFADNFVINHFDPVASPTAEVVNPTLTYVNMNAGIDLNGFLSNNIRGSMGFAAFNLNKPKETFLNATNALDTRYVAYFSAALKTGPKIFFFPSAQYMLQTTAQKLVAGGAIGFNMSHSRYKVGNIFMAGASVRAGDAVIVNAGLLMKQLHAGISYDVNTSSLATASGGNGGFEIAVIYFGQVTPIKRVRRTYCPRF